MVDLPQLFSGICGQHLEHTWAPGGIWLPLCQRCTGLYTGAGVAALLLFWLKPRPTRGFLATHGGFLLLMVPFGFHWVPQGPALRAITGLLFGCGVTAFLWLPLNQSGTAEPSAKYLDSIGWIQRLRPYALVLGVSLLLVTLLGAYGGRIAAEALTVQVCCSAVVLTMLVLANAWLGVMGAIKMVAPSTQAHTR